MNRPHITRTIALLLLALYVVEIVGTMAAFTAVRARIRSEVKQRLKASVPGSELIPLALHSGNRDEVQWIHAGEFRLRGSLYDIVRREERGDTLFLDCINDIQEERLFAGLDALVRRQMETDPRAGSRAGTGPSPGREHLPAPVVGVARPTVIFLLHAPPVVLPPSPAPEVPVPPPRSA